MASSLLRTQEIGSYRVRFFILFSYESKSIISRDTIGYQPWYEVQALVEFQGTSTKDGVSQGHYVCDVNNKDFWFKTNYGRFPEKIRAEKVSENGCSFLFQ